MKTRSLTRSHIYLSELGFGVASFLANPKFPEDKAISVIKSAIENGITYFDTGASYGGPRGGIAETRLGASIQGTPREKLIISTKAGTFYDNNNKRYKDFSAKSVENSILSSLDRLKTNYIDILYLHGPIPNQISNELIDVLEKYRNDGIVRTYGINTMDSEVADQFLESRYEIFEVFLITFNIMAPENRFLINKITSLGRSVVAGTAIGRALYSKERFKLYKLSNVWYLLRALANSRDVLFKSIRLRHLMRSTKATPVQIALCYALSNKEIVSAVFNTTSHEHLIENLASVNLNLPHEMLTKFSDL